MNTNNGNTKENKMQWDSENKYDGKHLTMNKYLAGYSSEWVLEYWVFENGQAARQIFASPCERDVDEFAANLISEVK